VSTEKRSFRFNRPGGCCDFLVALLKSDILAARPFTSIDLLDSGGEVVFTVNSAEEDRIRSIMDELGIAFEEIPVREITFDDLFG